MGFFCRCCTVGFCITGNRGLKRFEGQVTACTVYGLGRVKFFHRLHAWFRAFWFTWRSSGP